MGGFSSNGEILTLCRGLFVISVKQCHNKSTVKPNMTCIEEKLEYNKTIKYLAINANIEHLTFVNSISIWHMEEIHCYAVINVMFRYEIRGWSRSRGRASIVRVRKNVSFVAHGYYIKLSIWLSSDELFDGSFQKRVKHRSFKTTEEYDKYIRCKRLASSYGPYLGSRPRAVGCLTCRFTRPRLLIIQSW